MPTNPFDHKRFNPTIRRAKQTIRAEFFSEHLDKLDDLINSTSLTVSEILRRAILFITPEALEDTRPTIGQLALTQRTSLDIKPPWQCNCDPPKIITATSCGECETVWNGMRYGSHSEDL